MAGGPFKKAGAMNHRAAFGIFGTKDHPSDPSMADGACTHGAGLERDNEGQSGQPVVSDPFSRSPQGEDLSMGCGVI